MNSGVCVCVILAALSASCLGRPRSSSPDTDDSPLPSQMDGSLSGHHRVARSVSLSAALKQQPAADTRANLSELIAKIITKKGSVRRNSSMNNRANGANHRIKDRDYVGWMDFGRRSAEEYEYSS
ncbi:cholecystokinin-like [Xyrauchen texanus]|uniref:cholecystokinin-like n=1 Tax=Xyrauchen texanus TaxID=154827 RepID=UPI002241C3CA|nr:cholecystokinin-like [Xyrauchen texanus]